MRSKICYLCGLPLDGEIDDDHVPPRQFFAKILRKRFGPQLLTLPTHKACNKIYQPDEDYFITSIGPLVMDASVPGRALWHDISKRIQRPESVGLASLVAKEWDEKYGNIYLQNGKIAKRFNPDRVWGVIWKITRGLFFYETGRFLPKNTPKLFRTQFEVKGAPPDEFSLVCGAPTKGKYKAVFDYRYVVDDKLNNFNLWAMCLWDALIVMVGFHDPACPCEACKKVA